MPELRGELRTRRADNPLDLGGSEPRGVEMHAQARRSRHRIHVRFEDPGSTPERPQEAMQARISVRRVRGKDERKVELELVHVVSSCCAAAGLCIEARSSLRYTNA